MTIGKPQQPPGGRRTVHAALAKRLRRTRNGAALHGSPKTLAALPVYRVSGRAAAGAAPLSRPMKIGWCFAVIRGGDCAVAMLLIQAKRPVYAGLSEGAIGARLLDAASFAENALASSATAFEPRLLEIPALRLYLLWLFAARGRSRFVILSDRGAFGGNALATPGQIESLVKTALAAARLKPGRPPARTRRRPHSSA